MTKVGNMAMTDLKFVLLSSSLSLSRTLQGP